MSTCTKCNASLMDLDQYCPGCGTAVPPSPPSPPSGFTDDAAATARDPAAAVAVDSPPPLRSIIDPPPPPRRFGKVLDGMENQHRNRARQWLLALAALTAVSGFLMFGVLAPEDLDPEVAGTYRLLLVSNLVVSVFYFGMWFWARTNVLGATITSLVVYVTLQVISAASEPSTISQGFLIKIFFIGALIKAIREALAERAAGAP